MPIPVTLKDLLVLSAQKPSFDNCIISLMGTLCNYSTFFAAVLITRLCLCCSRAIAVQATQNHFPK